MAEKLTEELSSMDTQDIIIFNAIFNEYMNLSYKNKLWAAAYVINDGCSDDGFDYFRGWLIAKGKKIFLKALKDPESLLEIDIEAEEAYYEEMLGVCYDAYSIKNDDKEVYDLFNTEFEKYSLSDKDKNDIKIEINYADDIDIDWDEDTVKNIVPKICQRLGW